MDRKQLKSGELYFIWQRDDLYKPVIFICELPGGIGSRKMLFVDLDNNKIIKRTGRYLYDHMSVCSKFHDDNSVCTCDISKGLIKLSFQREAVSN